MKSAVRPFVWLVPCVLLSLGAGGTLSQGVPKQEQDRGSEESATQEKGTKHFRKLMQQKLDNSKNLLEGLALGDFKKIQKNADELQKLTKTAEWFAYKTKEYKLFSSEFRRAAEKVSKSAKQLNLDGAALGYLELTLTCVRCHQYVRNVADAHFREDHSTNFSFE